MANSEKTKAAESTAVSVAAPPTGALSLTVGQQFGGFKIKSILTIPRYLMKEGTPVALSPTGAFKKGMTAAKKGDAGAVEVDGRFQKEIDLLPCSIFTANSEASVNVDVIAPTIFKNELSEKYPENEFIGKKFLVHVFPQFDSDGAKKRANGVTIAELE